MHGYWVVQERARFTYQVHLTVYTDFGAAWEHIRDSVQDVQYIVRAATRMWLHWYTQTVARECHTAGFSVFPCDMARLRLN